MSNISIRQIPSVQRYANALFQLSKEAKVVDSVSKDLQTLKDIINNDEKFHSLVKNPSVSKSAKNNLFNAIAKKIELSKLTLNFIGVIIRKNRVNVSCWEFQLGSPSPPFHYNPGKLIFPAQAIIGQFNIATF